LQILGLAFKLDEYGSLQILFYTVYKMFDGWATTGTL
jgi:hypothetical protein